MPYYGISSGTLYISNSETSEATTSFSYPTEGYRFPWSDNTSVTAAVIQNKITPTNVTFFFKGLSNLVSITGLENIDISGVRSLRSMFSNCHSLPSLDLSCWDVSHITSLEETFVHCRAMTSLNVSNWDVSSVTNMDGPFGACSNLETLDVSNWNVSNVTNMYRLFMSCYNLITLDVSKWNVSKVTNLSFAFSQCASLTSVNLENWDVSNVTDMNNMFSFCTFLDRLDLSKWNVSKVTNMSQMFHNCGVRTLVLNGWDVSKVTNMSSMFERNGDYIVSSSYKVTNQHQLRRIYCSDTWTGASGVDSTNMFSGCTYLRGAITYDSAKTSIAYANPNTGYFTFSSRSVYVGENINKIPKSTDASGNVYGYKAGYRLNSSGVEVAANGSYITGYIPCKIGDVVHFKNMTWQYGMTEGLGSGNQRMAFYDSSFNHLGQCGAQVAHMWLSGIKDDSGVISQIIVESSDNLPIDGAAYFRLNCIDINDNSVITVNYNPPDTAAECEVAMDVHTMYVGIDNIARKIVKGYIGDENGIAQNFFGSTN